MGFFLAALICAAILIVIGVSVFMARLVQGRLRTKRARYWVMFALVSPAMLLSILPFLALAALIGTLLYGTLRSDASRLESVFPDVELASISKLVSTNSVWTGDDLFIGFSAKAGVVDDIVKRHGLKPYSDFPINGEKPDWWSDNACSAGKSSWGMGDYKIYASGEMKDHPRGWEHIMLLYCGRDGQVLIDAREPLD